MVVAASVVYNLINDSFILCLSQTERPKEISPCIVKRNEIMLSISLVVKGIPRFV